MTTTQPSVWTVLAGRRTEIGLAVLCLFLFCWRLGAARLFDLDEGVYVSAARNMAVTGDFVTPKINSRPHSRPEQALTPFFEKPIMVYWTSAASMRLFGVSEATARLPAALASLLTTLTVTACGWRWFGRRAGLLAGLIYATAPMTVLDARQMTTDALLTLWFLLTMIGFIERRPLLFWAASALAVLTKGVVGLLFPALVVGCYQGVCWYVARRRPLPSGRAGKARVAAHIAGIVAFLCIAVPWHVAVLGAGGTDLNGRNWVQEYLIRQHVGRFKGSDIHHNAPAPTYIVYFLIGFFPWACFAPFALAQPAAVRLDGEPPSPADPPGHIGVANATEPASHGTAAAGSAPPGPARLAARGEATVGSAQDSNSRAPAGADAAFRANLPSGLLDGERLMLLLKCWFWVIFLFFSASAAKLPTYIVPVYPAAALLVGLWLARRTSPRRGRVRSPLIAHGSPSPPGLHSPDCPASLDGRDAESEESPASSEGEGDSGAEGAERVQGHSGAEGAEQAKGDLPRSWLAAWLSRIDGLRAGALAAFVTALLLFTAARLIPVLARDRTVLPPGAEAFLTAVTSILFIGCCIALACLAPAGRTAGRTLGGVLVLAATMAVVTGAMSGPGYEIGNRWVFGPYQDLAILARPYAKEGLPVIYYAFGDRRPSMLYYARDYSPLERKETPLLPWLRPYLRADRPAAIVITLKSTLDEQLAPELRQAGWRWDVIATRSSGIADWRLLIARPEQNSANARMHR